MRRFTSPLNRVSVATPCPADWDRMVGGDRVRFCGQCQLNVYNLSAMSRDDAEALIARTEGRLCVRFYRRQDGSIITEDCPVGLRALKRRAVRIKTALMSSVLGLLAGIGAHNAANKIVALLPGSAIEWKSGGHTQGIMAMPGKPKPRAVVGVLVRLPRNQGKRVPSKRSLKS
jgi:hypothetical protein